MKDEGKQRFGHESALRAYREACPAGRMLSLNRARFSLILHPSSFILFSVFFAISAGATVPPKRAPAHRPNILLITLDTTRQDALGCYRDPKKEYPSIGWKPGMASATPILDALCAKGRKFTRAYTTAPITLVAHASILTGLYPPKHGVHDNGIYTLAKDVPTLPEILHQHGYQTGAAVSAIVLDRHYGLDRGFDHYDDRLGSETGGLQLEERKATQTVDAALKIVNGFRKEKPFFFWLHLYDPHNDYQAPEPYKSHFPPYLAEVAYMDHELGRFLDTLRKSGRIDDNTLLVITGDHGESLGEHGEQTHGIFLYEATLRVPLIIVGGRGDGWSGVDERLHSLTCIAPSILYAAGPSPERAFGGFNFSPCERPPNAIYAESELGANSYHWAPIYAAVGFTQKDENISWPRKFIRAPHPEQYSLQPDPQEKLNLAGEPAAEPWQRLLAQAISATQAGARKSQSQSDDPETRRKLQQLGYVSGGSAAPDDLPRPDPKDVIQLLPKFDEARGRAQKGDCQGAMPILLDILKQNPGNVPVTAQLGWCQLELKNPRAAVPLYAQAIKLNPSWEILHHQLGRALADSGDFAGAAREWRAALALNPRFALSTAALMSRLRESGQAGEAQAVYAAARQAGVEDGAVEFEAAVLAHARKDDAAAEGALRRALAADPGHVTARSNLANLLYGRKARRETILLYEAGLKLRPDEKEFLLPYAALLLEGCPDAGACPDAAHAALLLRRFLSAHPNDPKAPQVRDLLAGMGDR